MTAKPLFDIMRAIVAEMLDVKKHPHYEDRATFKELLGHIEKEYSYSYHKRNDLLHGTWFVGFGGTTDSEASDFFIRRLKTSADGLIEAKELPKNAEELRILAERCSDVRSWIGMIEFALTDPDTKITDVFEKSGKDWMLTLYPATKLTLPRK